MTTEPNDKNTSLRMPVRLADELALVAEARGESVNQAMVQAIAAYVADAKKDKTVIAEVKKRYESFLGKE